MLSSPKQTRLLDYCQYSVDYIKNYGLIHVMPPTNVKRCFMVIYFSVSKKLAYITRLLYKNQHVNCIYHLASYYVLQKEKAL